jgi:hypothetical protein
MNLRRRAHRLLLTALASALLLSACDDNNNNNSGGGEPPMPPAPTAQARQADDTDDLLQGPLARSSSGDYVLENDLLRVIIQKPGRNWFGLGTYGGNIIDASAKNDDGSFNAAWPSNNTFTPSVEKLVVPGTSCIKP